jgi:hypothetical protein
MPESPVKPVANDYSYLTDLYHGEYPKVLIQLPMYNEDAHCDLIIQRCCKIKWPSHRILIQVGTKLDSHGWGWSAAVLIHYCEGGCTAQWWCCVLWW